MTYRGDESRCTLLAKDVNLDCVEAYPSLRGMRRSCTCRWMGRQAWAR